jgi:hypothetical protein
MGDIIHNVRRARKAEANRRKEARTMNAEVAKRMEDMAALILKIPEERREEAFELLATEAALPEEAIQHFRKYVFYYHMFTNHRFYNAVEQTVCAMYCEGLNK